MIGKSMGDADEVADIAVVPPANKPPRAKGVGFALFIALIALFFTAVGIAAGYKHWQRMHDRAKDNARRIDVLETVLATKMDSRDLAALMTLPVTDVTEVSAKINYLLAQIPMRLATPMAAVVATSSGGDGGVLIDSAGGNRTVIPASAVAVTASGSGEASGSSVDGRVDGNETPDELVDDVASAQDSFWSICKQHALAVLNRFVSVQKVESSTVDTLKVEEMAAAHSLLRLRLESLRLMALQGDSRSYRQQIDLLRSTLSTLEKSVVVDYAPEQLVAWHAALDELAAVDLRSKPHDISVGLRQLRQQSQREKLVGAE